MVDRDTGRVAVTRALLDAADLPVTVVIKVPFKFRQPPSTFKILSTGLIHILLMGQKDRAVFTTSSNSLKNQYEGRYEHVEYFMKSGHAQLVARKKCRFEFRRVELKI